MSDLAKVAPAFVTPAEMQVMTEAGYGMRGEPVGPYGVVVVDATYAFVGRERLPIQEAVKRWRNACGEQAWDAVGQMGRLLSAARANEIPVWFTVGLRSVSGSTLTPKNERAGADDADDNVVVDELAPQSNEDVYAKIGPSAFFGTALASSMNALGVRALLVVGGVTSGCVRATVVDGYSLGYNVQVVHDGCFDRIQSSHQMSLFEMEAKYADVIDTDYAVQLFGQE